MFEQRGNLWQIAAGKMLVLATNGTVKERDNTCVMGRGIALEAKMRFPQLPYRLGCLIKEGGNHVKLLGGYGSYTILSAPVKHQWFEEADIELIRRSAVELAALADKVEAPPMSIYLPRLGCGNGKLSWTVVKPIISPILDDRFTAVTFGDTRVLTPKELVIKTSTIRYSGPDRLDITVKSGDKTFAPTWEMVNGLHRGTLAPTQYVEQYHKMMQRSWVNNKSRWIEVINSGSVTLCCYCAPGTFCHRYLLQEMLGAAAQYCNVTVIYEGETSN